MKDCKHPSDEGVMALHYRNVRDVRGDLARLLMHVYLVTARTGGPEFRTFFPNPSQTPGLLTLLHLNPTRQRRRKPNGKQRFFFPGCGWVRCDALHLPSSTHSPPLSWSLKDIAYKRDDSRRRPSSVVLLHLGATAACLWRDKVVPFSFCILRPIF